jgi:ribosomal protein S18 acetylase RimI-like enzyme
VSERFRGTALGSAMLRWAIEEARQGGYALVQLTTDKKRADAIRLYERLGFNASREGMKLLLTTSCTGCYHDLSWSLT